MDYVVFADLLVGPLNRRQIRLLVVHHLTRATPPALITVGTVSLHVGEVRFAEVLYNLVMIFGVAFHFGTGGSVVS